jgi:hypothetical protein
MKTIKLFALCTLLSLAWVACKNEATSETENMEEAAAETAVTASLSELTAHCSALSEAVTQKIADLETTISTTTDEGAKTAMTEQLTQFKGMQERLAEATKNVTAASEESLATVNEEIQMISKEIKTAMANTIASPAKQGQLSNQ